MWIAVARHNLKWLTIKINNLSGEGLIWLKLLGWLGCLKQKMLLPHPRVKVSIVGSLRDREVASSASDRQGSNFESCVWRTVSSHSSHHPQEVLLAQFSLYVHKGGLKPDSFHFIYLAVELYYNVNLIQTLWHRQVQQVVSLENMLNVVQGHTSLLVVDHKVHNKSFQQVYNKIIYPLIYIINILYII